MNAVNRVVDTIPTVNESRTMLRRLAMTCLLCLPLFAPCGCEKRIREANAPEPAPDLALAEQVERMA